MNLLVVTPWYPTGPSDSRGRYIQNSVEAVSRLGMRVSVLVVEPWKPQRPGWTAPRASLSDRLPAIQDYPVRRVSYPSLPRFRLAEISFASMRMATFLHVKRAVSANAADVVHVHTERLAIAAVPAAKAAAKPIVVTLHAGDVTPAITRMHERRGRLTSALEQADRILLVGNVLRRHFAQNISDTTKVRVIGNGFPDVLSRAPAEKPPWSGSIRITSASILAEGKGITYNLHALASLKAAGHTGWTYEVIGTGPLERDLKRTAAELGISDSVTWVGQLSHDAVIARLARSHVFLLPSYHEAFGVANLEAMAQGCVSVGVRGQGPSDYISDGETGFLVEEKSAGSIFSLLSTLLLDRWLMRRVAEAGQRLVWEQFRWTDHARRVSDEYVAVLNSGPTKATGSRVRSNGAVQA